MSACDPGPGGDEARRRRFFEEFGGASGLPRPLNVSEKALPVTSDESVASYKADGRRNVVIQNIGEDPVQVYVTNGLPFGAGGIILAGQNLAASPPQIGGVWSAHQDGVGVIQRTIFVRCAAGNSSTVSVNEES